MARINNFYRTLGEAQIEAQKLELKTKEEYQKGYRKNKYLTCNPDKMYKKEWKSWSIFLGKVGWDNYGTLIEAQNSVQSLGIKTSTEYTKFRFRDSLLPASPDKMYKGDWESWVVFLGNEDRFYLTLEEAQVAARYLGFRSSVEYLNCYKKDPKLPSSPRVMYKGSWKSWSEFLGVKKLYSTIEEARSAVQKYNFKTSGDYINGYKIDSRLPSSPMQIYREYWQSWSDFLGAPSKYYQTYGEAKKAVHELGVETSTNYYLNYKKDSFLPRSPNRVYVNEWKSWPNFLGRTKILYQTLYEAMGAARDLGFKGKLEFKDGYKLDPLLPSSPDQVYKDDWESWPAFLGKEIKENYETLQEAKTAAQYFYFKSEREYSEGFHKDPFLCRYPHILYKIDWISWPVFLGTDDRFYSTLSESKSSAKKMGFKSMYDYKKGYMKDSKLPSSPDKMYRREWKSWFDFLDKDEKYFYSTISEAMVATKKLGVKTMAGYSHAYRLDARLPSSPDKVYRNSWKSWKVFLDVKEKHYSTLSEAHQAVKKLGFKSSSEYSSGYKQDLKLPCSPKQKYKEEWLSWLVFLDVEEKHYPTLEEAKSAVGRFNIEKIADYSVIYLNDSRLPRAPDKKYKEDWISWGDFLGIRKKLNYKTLCEAREAVKILGFKSSSNYLKLYKCDPLLPANPVKLYASSWDSWSNFLSIDDKYYKTLEEAKYAAQLLGFLSSDDYMLGCKADPKLVLKPDKKYVDSWLSWHDFLFPKECVSLDILKRVCKSLGINNTKDYKLARKKYALLPSKPEAKFCENWISWYDLLDIIVPYSYQEASIISQKNEVTRKDKYKKLVIELGDPRLPKTPEKVYSDSWINWFSFLNTEAPFQPRFISEEYSSWRNEINEFMKIARSGGTKKQLLCKFQRLYIEKNELGFSPVDYLTKKNNISEFLLLLDKETVTIKKKWIHAVNSFLDWVIETKLSLEDEETGQVLSIGNAFNPLSRVNFDGETHEVVRNETNKSVLPYTYTKNAREWIFPSSNTNLNYSDLAHLQKFGPDWVEVSNDIIDCDDPDCVVKIIGDKTYIWFPVYWTYTYALMQLPARGRQIVYSDSGEADNMIPIIKMGDLIWIKNTSNLSGQTNHQGMVSLFEKGEFGVYYTSNKTHMSGKGYGSPYMSFDLAYWLIKLRIWQQKYNPISSVTAWEGCLRTNLNETQLKQKGSNCFLFRDFDAVEPGAFAGRLSYRLACSLFFSGTDDLPLAVYDGYPRKHYSDILDSYLFSISSFKSEYTPHSMRVSLINALVFEFGLPVEDVMKLVGHSSLVMTIYYLKSDQQRLRLRMKKGEKLALKNEATSVQRLVEQRRIDECKTQLTANDEEFLNSLSNDRNPAGYQFKDFGFCPVGGSRCQEGGQYAQNSQKSNIRLPVEAGYLGYQNCLRCRFFVTGVGFMGGLVALANEISLQVHAESGHYQGLLEEIKLIEKKKDLLDDEMYKKLKEGLPVDDIQPKKNIYNQELRKTESELETVANRLDLYLTDIQYNTRHLNRCNDVINNKQMNGYESEGLQLIIQSDSEVAVVAEKSSYFQQLCEVCDNAEIYQSCSDKLAVTPRSQLLDKLALNNGLTPILFTLSEKTQLLVGNQMVELFMARVKSWDKLDALIDGRLMISELDVTERVSRIELDELFRPKLLIDKELA